ncbi:ISAs1 family transposase [Rubinisphaera italica]|uniref:Transposase DDE domain protein n=1 Tax=Rubinisphaera italica TaxID=2527969 RepID=A0A5C5XJJ7_9PLAN|nr:ISAs1 family transposase [Rubinisphaera italica]TWT59797.1 Transposase DDE domain protein [Rubinisphaera italica]TWT61721.1 Transposase DDE domain protein [Rubinisphaera italica]TWT63367.1 Transposase DDE domain protein [Rubinisphaera italica]TWT63700.1 Transposase DDE domain protein [Rubinisphaera italica]
MFSNPLSFLLFFEDLADPREDYKVTHSLSDMIFLALCGAVANCDHWTEIEIYARNHLKFLKKYVSLKNGVPSHDTFSRVFSRLDPVAFSECLIKWVDSLQSDLASQGVHLDGKVLRRSFDKAAGKGALNVVTAWAGDLHLCLGQLPVEEGTNEKTAMPKLIELLELSGAVVTVDAAHTNKSVARQLRGKNADYVMTVKGNQPKLYEIINQKFEELSENDFQHPKVRRHTTRESNGGRDEYRRYTVFPAPAEVKQLGWVDVKSIGMVYRERTVNGKTSQELIYFISSLPPKVRTLAKHVRDHWKIENQMHWSLDVTFAEDTSRIRKGEGAANAAIFRRLALTILKRYTDEKMSIRSKRLTASWNSENLLRYLTGNQA